MKYLLMPQIFCNFYSNIQIFKLNTVSAYFNFGISGAPQFTEHNCTNPGPIRGQHLFVEFSNPGNDVALAEVEIFGKKII